MGFVELSIADEAYEVALHNAFANNPTLESQFGEQTVHNVSEIVPGHQCYSIGAIPSGITAGTNATIQLEYWAKYESEINGRNESFLACADVTLANVDDLTTTSPCFNVTKAGFDSGGNPASTPSTSAGTYSPAASPSSARGLSGGAKAGIAIGSIIGAVALGSIGALIHGRKHRRDYMERRRRTYQNDPILLTKRNVDGTSVNSAK